MACFAHDRTRSPALAPRKGDAVAAVPFCPPPARPTGGAAGGRPASADPDGPLVPGWTGAMPGIAVPALAERRVAGPGPAYVTAVIRLVAGGRA
jgi:hypothetical protein